MVKGIKQIRCVPDMPTHPVVANGRPVTSNRALLNCPGAAPGETQCNYSWNGYMEGDGTQPGFNDVYGRWNVECVTGSLIHSGQSSWVGLGGAQPGDNLWQAGSSWDPFYGYRLWYEAVGGPYSTIGPQYFANVHCGDHIFAEVWFAANDPTSNVGFAVIDNGTEYDGYAPSGFSSGNINAEWIDERPGCGVDEFHQLADYNYSEWTTAYASPNDPTAGYYAIGDLAHTRLWIKDNDGTDTRLAWADYLGSETGWGNDNFQGHWEGNGSAQC